jgi:hypothetical protein
MKHFIRAFKFLALLLGLFLILPATLAQAQATRTWVSGVGDDVNPCSRTAPCKTFAGAISKTAAGGEISVLDPGGYGGVTITKSISITNDGAGEAGILVAGTNGITVNAGANDVVRIHGIIIDGGNGLTSPAGIRFLNGGELHVENCVIRNFQLASAGFGIHFTPTNPANLYVSDTVIVHNINGTNGGGIHIVPNTPGGVLAMLNRVQMYNNGFGVKLNGTTSTGRIRLHMRDSTAAQNATNGIWVTSTNAQSAIFAVNSSIAANLTNGALVDGNQGFIILNGTSISSNNIGVAAINSGTLFSFKNNAISTNITSDGTIPPGNILPLN